VPLIKNHSYLKNLESREDIYARLGISSSAYISKNERAGLGGSPLRSHLRNYRDSANDRENMIPEDKETIEEPLINSFTKRNSNFSVP